MVAQERRPDWLKYDRGEPKQVKPGHCGYHTIVSDDGCMSIARAFAATRVAVVFFFVLNHCSNLRRAVGACSC